MKNILLITFVLITNFVNAQSLSGVSKLNIGTCFTSVDWEVSYSFQMVAEGVAIQFYNPRITVSSSSEYYTKGQLYSKQSLGLSSWPNENQNPQNMVISFTVSHQEGYGNSINSQPCFNGKFVPTIVLRKSNVKNWENISISSFRVISTERMMYANTGSIEVDNLIDAKKNSTSNNNSNNNNPATQTGTTNTGIPASTSGNDPLAHFQTDSKAYNNPMSGNTNSGSTALDNFNKGYQQGQQIADVAIGIADLFSASPEKKARQEREENLRIEKEEAASRVRANKIQMIASRKRLINNYPDGKAPLSSQAQGVTEVYYFVYSCSQTELEMETPKMYLSDVFTSPKYGDGTWPFKNNITEKVSKQNKNIKLVLSGFYESETEAEQKQNYFLRTAKNAGFEIVNLKNVIVASSTAPETTTTDFWGNTAAGKAKVETKTETPQTTKKVEVDFWGNPIK